MVSHCGRRLDEPSAHSVIASLARRLGVEIQAIRNQADNESAVARAHDARRVDHNTMIVLIVGAVSLTFGQFLSRDTVWLEHVLRLVAAPGVAADVREAMSVSDHAQFWQLLEWVSLQIVGYIVLPAIVVRFVLRVPFSTMGLRVRGIRTMAAPYVVLYLVSVPFLVVVSNAAEFQSRYPFYDLAPRETLWPYLWAWWAGYAIQFMALEFFFRGFLVHGLVPRFGYMAVFVMAFPYNMLHYGKPMMEAIAAIVGGVVLGTLAIRARSIWWGAALHISIAATMDVLSLWHQGRIF
jgi:uncharacterized protein